MTSPCTISNMSIWGATEANFRKRRIGYIRDGSKIVSHNASRRRRLHGSIQKPCGKQPCWNSIVAEIIKVPHAESILVGAAA